MPGEEARRKKEKKEKNNIKFHLGFLNFAIKIRETVDLALE